MRPVPQEAVTFLQEHEKLVLRVYDDLQPRVILKPTTPILGALTAGYGHTGDDVRVSMIVTQEKADAWLRADLAIAAERLWRRIGSVVEELTDNQYAALLSFVFNLGVDGKMAKATIWTRLKARQFDQVPGEMMKFVNAGGKKLQGLVNRRSAEVALFTTFEPGIEHETPPSSAIRLMETAPTPAEPTAARKNPGILAAILAPFIGFAALVKEWFAAIVAFVTPDNVQQGIAAIQPYADKSSIVETALQGLAVVGSIVAAWWFVKKHNEQRR